MCWHSYISLRVPTLAYYSITFGKIKPFNESKLWDAARDLLQNAAYHHGIVEEPPPQSNKKKKGALILVKKNTQALPNQGQTGS